MSTSASLRLAFLSNGVPRCILSAFERASGDLILNLRSNQQQRSLGKPAIFDNNPDLLVSDFRYSIHTSNQTKNELNVIKLTKVFESGRLLEMFQFTTAMKKQNSFAPIYVNRFDNLQHANNDIKKRNGKFVNLGDVHPGATLIMMVAVGPCDRLFTAAPANDFLVKQFQFKVFNLVVLWCFVTIPANITAMSMHVGTTRHSGAATGMDEAEIIKMFRSCRHLLRDELIQALKAVPDEAKRVPFLDYSTYITDASEHSRDWRKWALSLRQRGLV